MSSTSAGGTALGGPPAPTPARRPPISPARRVLTRRSPSPSRSSEVPSSAETGPPHGAVQRQREAVGSGRAPRRSVISQSCAARARSRTGAASRARSASSPRTTRTSRTSRWRSVALPSMTGMKSTTSPTPSGVRNRVIRIAVSGKYSCLAHVVVPVGRDPEVPAPVVVEQAKRRCSASRNAGSRTSRSCRRW